MKIRMIRESDLNDILEISRHIWEGYDYLPLVINGWLLDPYSFTYSVEVSNRIVAVANLRVIENGLTGWMEGFRVHPGFRRKGFANRITEYFIKTAEDLGVQRFRYTTSVRNQASLRIAEKFDFKKVLEMSIFLQSVPKKIPSIIPSIKKSYPNEFYTILKGDIIPKKVLIYDWKALDSTLDGFNTIGAFHEYYISLKNMVVNALSYAYTRQGPEGPMWIFSIYATTPKDFLLHFSYNASKASQNRYKSIICTYQLNFQEVLHDIEWVSADHWDTNLVLLERILN